MVWRSIRGVLIVSWGKFCKKWSCCCLCYPYFSWSIAVKKSCQLFGRIVCACALAFYPTHLPHEGPNGGEDKAGIIMDKSSRGMKCLNFCLEEYGNRLVFDFYFFPHTAEKFCHFTCVFPSATLWFRPCDTIQIKPGNYFIDRLLVTTSCFQKDEVQLCTSNLDSCNFKSLKRFFFLRLSTR